MPNQKEIIEALQSACQNLPVVIAYIHGSYASGHQDKESDLDIAILANEALNAKQRHDLRMDVTQSLLETLGDRCPDPDVVVLQDVPILLQYNVVRSGLCVYECTRGERAAFDLAVEQAYDDERPYLNREAKITIRRLLAPLKA